MSLFLGVSSTIILSELLLITMCGSSSLPLSPVRVRPPFLPSHRPPFPSPHCRCLVGLPGCTLSIKTCKYCILEVSMSHKTYAILLLGRGWKQRTIFSIPLNPSHTPAYHILNKNLRAVCCRGLNIIPTTECCCQSGASTLAHTVSPLICVVTNSILWAVCCRGLNMVVTTVCC